MSQIEDIPYNAPDFATPDVEQKTDDADQVNKSVLSEIQKYFAEQIEKHNSLDVIEPNSENIMTTQQQIVVHREVVTHLRTAKTLVDNKIKELR